MKNFYIFVLLLSNISVAIAADKGGEVVRLADPKQRAFEKIISEELTRGTNPLSEDHVRDIKKNIDEWKRKQNSQLKDPIIQNRAFSINFKPRTKPEELYFSPNYTTTLIFLDKLGNPWPLKKYVIGNAAKFQVEQLPPSTLIITPLEEYAYGNLTVMFEDKNVPAIFTIKTLGDMVDYKVEARIEELGPKSANNTSRIVSTGGTSYSSAATNPYSHFPDADITNLLNGEPPKTLLDGKKGVIGHPGTEVYELGGKLYILTSSTTRVNSPAPLDARQSANGRKLFITMAMPFIYLTDNGELIKVQITD